MATPQPGQQFDLQVRRTFRAPREKVFAAWTRREYLAQWMCKATPQHHAEYLEHELRPGGRYRIKNIVPSGDTLMVYGEYREIRPLEKVSFTWSCDRTTAAGGNTVNETGETLVTVEFFERGKSTEVVLTHTGFTSADMRARHEHGWNGCFDMLAGVL